MRSGALPPCSWVRSDEAVAVRGQALRLDLDAGLLRVLLGHDDPGALRGAAGVAEGEGEAVGGLGGAPPSEPPSSSPPPPQAASVSALSADTATSEPKRRNRRWLCWVIDEPFVTCPTSGPGKARWPQTPRPDGPWHCQRDGNHMLLPMSGGSQWNERIRMLMPLISAVDAPDDLRRGPRRADHGGVREGCTEDARRLGVASGAYTERRRLEDLAGRSRSFGDQPVHPGVRHIQLHDVAPGSERAAHLDPEGRGPQRHRSRCPLTRTRAMSPTSADQDGVAPTSVEVDLGRYVPTPEKPAAAGPSSVQGRGRPAARTRRRPAGSAASRRRAPPRGRARCGPGRRPALDEDDRSEPAGTAVSAPAGGTVGHARGAAHGVPGHERAPRSRCAR